MFVTVHNKNNDKLFCSNVKIFFPGDHYNRYDLLKTEKRFRHKIDFIIICNWIKVKIYHVKNYQK